MNKTFIKTENIPQTATHQYHITNDSKPYSFSINQTVVVRYLMFVFSVLFVMNFASILQLVFVSTTHNYFTVMFSFDMENNFPTLFSSIILLISSGLLLVIALLKNKQEDHYARQWLVLSFIFLALSIDESLSFHNKVEKFLNPMRSIIDASSLLRFSWVIVAGVLVVLFVIAYLRFFLALSTAMRVRFFTAGAMYVIGAVGFEMIGAYLFTYYGETDKSLPYMIGMTIEETLEMTGIIFFIHTLLKYLSLNSQSYKLKMK